MGGTNCPETPRQRMIGMMYLVLTAMLALNVSKDILNAFVIVDETMLQTTANFDTKIASTFQMFATANMSQPEKVGPNFKKAQQVQKLTDDMVNFIVELRSQLFMRIEKKTLEEAKKMTLKDVAALDNKDIPHNYFINEKKGIELKSKIVEYRKKILELVDDPLRKPEENAKSKAEMDKKIGLETKDGVDAKTKAPYTWEDHAFGETVLAACVTMLNKLSGEVKNVEFDMLTYLMGDINAKDFKFDNVTAKVLPESRLVFSGTEYSADIIVAAFDSRQNPEVYYKMGLDTATESMVSGMTKLEGKDGVVNLKLPAGGSGEQKFAGLIKIKSPDGTDKYYPFKSKFVVTKPMANVSADSLRILYDGIDNLISVAAPVAPEKLRVNFGGCVSRANGPGRYLVKPPKGAKVVTISVSADMDGRMQNMGGTPFRVRTVPSPNATIIGRVSGKVNKSEILGFGRVVANMNSDFAYPLKWAVTSYEVSIKRPSEIGKGTAITNNGAMFSGAVRDAINNAPAGSRVSFDEINISNPILGNRPTNPISFKLK